MTADVESIHGGPALAARVPSENAIEEVENLLERLKSGETQGVVFAALDHDGASFYRIAGRIGAYSLHGALQIALTDLARQHIE